MKRSLSLFVIVNILSAGMLGQDSTRISGQLSSWVNINTGNELPLWGGVRYIPQFNYSSDLDPHGQYDTEVSFNIYGTAGLKPFETISTSGKVKPYRAWFRYTSDQLELRFGLQKLNFGSATMLRPLMWFDQMDSRDPLKLTDGVWGVLARYYFLNNSNIWLWGLYGNKERRGWEIIPSNCRIPEFGGRIQFPVPAGEVAFSYHHRTGDSRDVGNDILPFEKIPENKFGFDAKWDLVAGMWLEGSFTNKGKNVGIYTNQMTLNAGIDYTFALGSGLYIAYEQLLSTFDETPFSFSNSISFSLMTMSYPLGLFDRLSTALYYNWYEETVFTFMNWQKQFDKVTLYLMAFWNPDTFQLPAQESSHNLFAGKGLQFMFVYNH